MAVIYEPDSHREMAVIYEPDSRREMTIKNARISGR